MSNSPVAGPNSNLSAPSGWATRVRQWFSANSGAVHELIIALIVTVPIAVATLWLDDRRTTQANHLEDLRSVRAERLENLRFVRDRTGLPGPKPFAEMDLTGMNLSGLDLGCEVDEEGVPIEQANCTDPSCAKLTGAILSYADLTGACGVPT